MAEKRKISCPAATGTGENKKYENYINYSSYEEKKQEVREIIHDIFGCALMFASCGMISLLLLLIGG